MGGAFLEVKRASQRVERRQSSSDVGKVRARDRVSRIVEGMREPRGMEEVMRRWVCVVGDAGWSRVDRRRRTGMRSERMDARGGIGRASRRVSVRA